MCIPAKLRRISGVIIITVLAVSCGFFDNDKNTVAEDENNPNAISLTYTVQPEDGAFAIMFPGTPDYTNEPVDTETGILENRMYIYEHSIHLAYMLAFTDYANDQIEQYHPDELLNNAMEGFTAEIGIIVEKKQKVSIQNHSGIEFTASGQGYWAFMRDYLVGNRLYQIGLLSTNGAVNEDDANAFFNSFKLK